MIKPRPYDFYSIATYLQPLKILRAGLQLSGNTTIIQMLTYARIGTILFTGDKFNEKHLPGAFDELKTLGEYLDEKLNKLPQHGEWDKTLEPAKVQAVQDIIHSFEVSLERELGELPIFCCEDDLLGNLSVKKLLDGAHKRYPEATRKHMPESCFEEIDESGRCLAYERPTASGFHILRAVELTILAYLLAIPRFVMPPINRQNWGEYIEQLRKANGDGKTADKETIDHMQSLKDHHRNPLMHPRDTLTIPEAVSLFAIGQSTIEIIVADGLRRGILK